MDAAEIEREYLEFCELMRKDAMTLMAMAHNKRDHDAIANYALGVADTANARAHQYRMQKERAGRTAGAYDLAALRVDTTVPSDSETGFEDRG